MQSAGSIMWPLNCMYSKQRKFMQAGPAIYYQFLVFGATEWVQKLPGWLNHRLQLFSHEPKTSMWENEIQHGYPLYLCMVLISWFNGLVNFWKVFSFFLVLFYCSRFYQLRPAETAILWSLFFSSHLTEVKGDKVTSNIMV